MKPKVISLYIYIIQFIRCVELFKPSLSVVLELGVFFDNSWIVLSHPSSCTNRMHLYKLYSLCWVRQSSAEQLLYLWLTSSHSSSFRGLNMTSSIISILANDTPKILQALEVTNQRRQHFQRIVACM